MSLFPFFPQKSENSSFFHFQLLPPFSDSFFSRWMKLWWKRLMTTMIMTGIQMLLQTMTVRVCVFCFVFSKLIAKEKLKKAMRSNNCFQEASTLFWPPSSNARKHERSQFFFFFLNIFSLFNCSPSPIKINNSLISFLTCQKKSYTVNRSINS